jgi:aldehyde oxidoreductase
MRHLHAGHADGRRRAAGGNPAPDRGAGEDALGGVLCRCTGYRKIIAAVCDAWRDARPTPCPARGRRWARAITRLDGAERWRAPTASAPTTGARRAGAARRPLAPPPRGSPSATSPPGVRPGGAAHVFTAADIPGVNRFGVIPPLPTSPRWRTGEVRFRGEAVALVAFEEDGRGDLSRFPVTWQPTDPLPRPRAAEGAPPRSTQPAPATG